MIISVLDIQTESEQRKKKKQQPKNNNNEFVKDGKCHGM